MASPRGDVPGVLRTWQVNDMALTFGKVPHPGYIDIQDEMADKREGYGWDNLGKRSPKFITLHRMVGSLAGTRQHFGNPDVASLTDYGLGIEAVDGKNGAGVIHKYNDPLGYRSGWASGRVSAPYGAGAALVDKYGINVVNRDGVSVEVSGTNEPLDDFSWGELVKLCAYWIDYMKVPYTSLPTNPHTGIDVLVWHQEFTIGTGKKCPFQWLMDNTNRLYADIAVYLKPFQEGTASSPPPAPKPVTRTVDFLVPMMIRTSPGFWDADKNQANVVTTLPAGTRGTVISGPVQKDGLDWYDVKVDGFGTGWVAKQIVNAIQVK